MASIVQSDNLTVTSETSFTQTFFEAAYGMPNVQGGHALVVIIGGTSSSTPGAGVTSITDNYGNQYEQIPGAYTQNEASNQAWQDVWWAQNVAQVTDPGKTLALTFQIASGAGAVGIVLVECSGINGATLAVGGNAFFHNPDAPFDGPSVNGDGGALYLASLCSLFAAAGDSDNSAHASVNSPWAFPALSGTGNGGSGFSWTGEEGPCVVGLVSTGTQQPIFNTTAVGTPPFDGGVITVVAFIGGGGNSPTISGPFLGSIVEDSSAPALPFLGSVHVISSAPNGKPGPYLGRVKIVTPSGSGAPFLGTVVVVSEAPSGDNDPALGSVESV